MHLKDCRICLADFFDCFVIKSLQLLFCLISGCLKTCDLCFRILNLHTSDYIVLFGNFLDFSDCNSPECNLSGYVLHLLLLTRQMILVFSSVVKIKKAEKALVANGVLLFRFSTFACELSLNHNFIISFHKVFVNTILPVCVLLLHPPLHIDSFPVFLHRRNQRIHSKL